MKKALSSLLVILTLVTSIIAFVPMVEAEAEILNSSSVDGGDFTDSQALADMLNVVFSGDIDIYNYDCDNKIVKAEASMPLGTKMSTNACFYVKSKVSGSGYSGQQCYIYANAVYNKLFNEVVYQGSNFAHSKVVISGGSKAVSFDMFNKAGVRCGAYMRTTCNSNGSYHYKYGHSMIVLSYDENHIIYLGGNQSGYGEIDVRKETWSEFNNGRVGGVGRYISHIVQPTDEYYEKLYPSHKCTNFTGLGICTDSGCGKTYDWEKTFNSADAGTYKVSKDFTPRTNAPYDAATKASGGIKKGNTVNVEGSYTNAYNNKWYKFTYDNGKVGYVLASEYLSLVNYNSLSVTCSGFTPTENESLPLGQGYPVWGTVKSNYPLTKVVAKLDGKEYATWTASNKTTTSFAINPTDINQNLKFGSLSAGKHTITLIATDIHGRTQTFLTRNFNMVSTSCSHTYGTGYGYDANNHWKVCSKCNSTASTEAHIYSNSCDTSCNTCGYTRTITHTYDTACDTACNVCGATRTANHTYERCSDEGYHWKKCTTCGAKTTSETHDWITTPFEENHTFICSECYTSRVLAHEYDSASDNTCNVCGYTRELTHEHKYSNACDTTCNTCGAVRVIAHEYSNACDTSCNICGETRATSHKYSNACDSSCDVCGAIRSVPDHVYDHGCDTSCNNCGYSRPTSHKYDNNCDKDCNNCGAVRTVSHTYSSYYLSDEAGHWRECTSCGHIGYGESHTPGAAATESKAQTCTKCGYVIQGAIGHTHNYSGGYKTDGVKHWLECSCGATKNMQKHQNDNACDESCNVCGHERVTEHKFTHACDTECNNCGFTRVIEHNFDNGRITKEPTTAENGEITFTCYTCGEKKVEDIAALTDTPENPENPENPEDPENSETPENPESPENPEEPQGGLDTTTVITVAVAAASASVAAVSTVVIIKKKPSSVKPSKENVKSKENGESGENSASEE